MSSLPPHPPLTLDALYFGSIPVSFRIVPGETPNIKPQTQNPKPQTPNPKAKTSNPQRLNPQPLTPIHPRRHPTLRRLTLAPTSFHRPRSPVTLPPRSKSRRYIHLQSSNPSNHNIIPLTHIINRWATFPPTRNTFPRLPQRPLPPPGRGRVPCAA